MHKRDDRGPSCDRIEIEMPWIAAKTGNAWTDVTVVVLNLHVRQFQRLYHGISKTKRLSQNSTSLAGETTEPSRHAGRKDQVSHIETLVCLSASCREKIILLVCCYSIWARLAQSLSRPRLDSWRYRPSGQLLVRSKKSALAYLRP